MSLLRTTGTYRAALRAARAAARLAPELHPRIAATVRENLRLAFGRADGALVRAIYRHFAEAAVDLVFFNRLFDAARLGAYVHGLAGDLAAKERGEIGLIASDLVDRIPLAIRQYQTLPASNWCPMGCQFRDLLIQM